MICTLVAQATPAEPQSVAVWFSVWIPLLSTVVGGLSVAVSNYLLNRQRFKHEDRMDKRGRLVLKVEETHQAAEWRWRSLAASCMELSAFIVAPNAPNLVQQVREQNQKMARPLGPDLTMLVDLYFPDLYEKAMLIADAEAEYANLTCEIAQMILASPNMSRADRESQRDRLQAKSYAVHRAVRSVQEALAAIAKALS
jgi:hypothetical protein